MSRSENIMSLGSADRENAIGGNLLRRLKSFIISARQDKAACRARRVLLIMIVLWIVSMFDLIFTLLAKNLGDFVEMNPIAAQFIEHPILLIFFKILAVAFASVIILKFRRRRMTEVSCWCLFVVYVILSGIWWIYYAVHPHY